ncbi:MAG: membrane protein insertase YidC [Tepidisphaerales bacterium]
MDNKRLFLAMFVGLGLMLLWVFAVQWLDKRYPEWNLMGRPTTQPAAAPAPPPSPVLTPPTSPGPSAAASETPATPIPPPTDGSQPDPRPESGTPAPAPSQLTSADTRVLRAVGDETPAAAPIDLGAFTANDPQFAMGVRLSPRGAGIDAVVLNSYRQRIHSDDRYTFQTPAQDRSAAGNDPAALIDATRVLATRHLMVDGVRVDFASLVWRVAERTQTSAAFEADVVAADGTPRLRLRKLYQLSRRSDPSLGYELTVQMSWANASGSNVTVSGLVSGPATPPWEIERGPERQVLTGYINLARREVNVRHTMVESFSAEKPRFDLSRDGDRPDPLAWFGTSGAYFNALVRPEPIPGSENPVLTPWLARVEAVLVNPGQRDNHLREVHTAFETAPILLQPGQSVTLPLRVYLGPKKRSILETAYYADFPLQYDQTLVITTWLCSFCTFQWLIRLLVWMLNAFHFVVRDWGVAIILLVVVVRLLLHPITRKSQENIVKMGKMAPELERLKKKYGDDKEALNRALMQFYKEQGATPLLGCLPMFLQMPIWIALYAALQSTFELRQSPFFYNLTWIADLSKPDHLIEFPTVMLCGVFPISGLNLIPFLLCAAFYLQFKLTPKPPVQTPEQLQQQKMMQWMTLLFPVFLYNMPAGLNIYILTSTTFGMIENKLIRDAIKRKEEAAAATAPVVVDAGPTRSSKKVKSTVKPAEPQRKGLMAWLEEMQEKAEQIRRQQEKRKG